VGIMRVAHGRCLFPAVVRPMHNRDMRRRILLVSLLAVLVIAFLRLSERSPTKISSDDGSRSTPPAKAARTPSPAEASSPAHVAPSAAPATTGITSAPQPNASTPTLQLQVQVPALVPLGQAFEARIDIGPNAGLHRLVFVVAFDAKRLALVGTSVGSLGQQTSAPVQFVAQETSYGSVQVTFETENGVWVTGSGTVAVLQFETTKAGSSVIALHDVTIVDAAGASYRNVDVKDGSIDTH